MSDAPADDGIFQRLNSSLGAITAIVAAIVGFNTAVTTCSDQSIARHNRFREAVKAEETFWKGLYDEYLGTFERTIANDPNRRRAKLFAIANLANHGVPDFGEFAVDDRAKVEAARRLLAIQRALIDALQDPQASGNEVAQQARLAAYLADQQRPAPERAASAAVEERAEAQLATTASAPASFSYQTRVLATGVASGWDVDVFWCQGPNELNDFARAQSVGNVIAAKSAEEAEIGPGVRLGRVRVRSLPGPAQPQRGDPGRGNVVIFDAGAGEQGAAAAIRALVNPTLPGGFRLVRTRSSTHWYVSVFICPAG